MLFPTFQISLPPFFSLSLIITFLPSFLPGSPPILHFVLNILNCLDPTVLVCGLFSLLSPYFARWESSDTYPRLSCSASWSRGTLIFSFPCPHPNFLYIDTEFSSQLSWAVTIVEIVGCNGCNQDVEQNFTALGMVHVGSKIMSSGPRRLEICI